MLNHHIALTFILTPEDELPLPAAAAAAVVVVCDVVVAEVLVVADAKSAETED